jgi:hypothetical protein
MDRAELIDRKRKLYVGFLDLPVAELSESDLRVMQALALDKDIQALLDKALGEKNKEQVYDSEINPLMAEIIKVCKKNGIAMIAHFALPTDDDPDLRCTTKLPDGEGKTPDDIRQMVSIGYASDRTVMAAFTITKKRSE